ncbi:MAG: hypothetical protein ABSF26_06760 [Thermoguttaceae bacterium]|jgi:hypothetical protein
MEKEPVTGGKSFDSQLLPTGEPNSEWGLGQLGVYAQLQYRQIMDGEKSLTTRYWRLGLALVLARSIFKHGLWSQHLKDLGIDKTRASKARAIYRAFAKAGDVAGLRVDEAYARRKRKLAKSPIENTNKESAATKDAKMLRASIGRIAKKTGSVIHTAAYAEPKDAKLLIPAVRKAIQQLEELLRFLEEQAAKAPADGQLEAGAVTLPTLVPQTGAVS